MSRLGIPSNDPGALSLARRSSGLRIKDLKPYTSATEEKNDSPANPSALRQDFDLKPLTALKKLVKPKDTALIDSDPHAAAVKSFLSVEECKHYLEQAENHGFHPKPGSNRNVSTLVVRSPDVAALLWKRIAAHFRSKDIAEVRPQSLGNQGTWVPYGLHELFGATRVAVPDPTTKTGEPKLIELPELDLHDIATIGDNDLQPVYAVTIFLNQLSHPTKVVLEPTFSKSDPKSNLPTAAGSTLPCTIAQGSLLFHTYDLAPAGSTTAMLPPKVIDMASPRDPKDKLYFLRGFLLFQRTDTHMALETSQASYAADSLSAHTQIDRTKQWEVQNNNLLADMLSAGAADWQAREAAMLGLDEGDDSDAERGQRSSDDDSEDEDGQLRKTSVDISKLKVSEPKSPEPAELPKLYTAADVGPDSYALDPLEAFAHLKNK